MLDKFSNQLLIIQCLLDQLLRLNQNCWCLKCIIFECWGSCLQLRSCLTLHWRITLAQYFHFDCFWFMFAHRLTYLSDFKTLFSWHSNLLSSLLLRRNVMNLFEFLWWLHNIRCSLVLALRYWRWYGDDCLFRLRFAQRICNIVVLCFDSISNA